MEKPNTILKIEMLGDFTIIENGRRIAERAKRPSKVWRLIHYLVAHKERAVPQDELLDVFCKDENKGNPGSILRTMVYRARAILEESGLECADDIIVAKSGCYSWNSGIECSTDAEIFEELTKKAGMCSDDDEKLSLLLQAAEMYKGDYLQGSRGDMWVIPLVRHYRGLYINAVHEALRLLMQKGHIDQAQELSVKALGIDPFDEDFIHCYLRTLITQGKTAEARDVYKKMETMFYDELGVDFSDELHDLYKEIQDVDSPQDTPLQDVVSNWLTDVDATNTYYCDSSEFKTLCRVESLSAPRTGLTTYIVRFNTRHDQPAKTTSRADSKGGVMKNLEQAITCCLRASDIYTRYGPSQYMVMLRSLTYEDCKMLINKILGKVDAKYLSKIVDTSIMHVAPVENKGENICHSNL